MTVISPQVDYWLFDDPIIIVAALVLLGGAMMVAYRRQRKAVLAKVGLAGLLLAAVLMLAARLVRTDREIVHQRSRDLVMATHPLDMPAVDALLSPRAVLMGPNDTPWLNRDQIRGVLMAMLSRHPLASQSVTRIDAQVTAAGSAVSHLSVRTVTASEGTPIFTQWELRWSKPAPGDRWQVSEIHWLSIQNQSPQQGLLGG